MLIHIGAGYLVREDDIIGYFDMDGKVDSAVTKEFLKNADKNGRCDTAGTDLPRSFVLTAPRNAGRRMNPCKNPAPEAGERQSIQLSANNQKVIFTHISTQALKKR